MLKINHPAKSHSKTTIPLLDHAHCTKMLIAHITPKSDQSLLRHCAHVILDLVMWFHDNMT